jgi:hypothetical protein
MTGIRCNQRVHELEADIEPFRGLLLALFFMGVGMSIDMGVVTSTHLGRRDRDNAAQGLHRGRAVPCDLPEPR